MSVRSLDYYTWYELFCPKYLNRLCVASPNSGVKMHSEVKH